MSFMAKSCAAVVPELCLDEDFITSLHFLTMIGFLTFPCPSLYLHKTSLPFTSSTTFAITDHTTSPVVITMNHKHYNRIETSRVLEYF